MGIKLMDLFECIQANYQYPEQLEIIWLKKIKLKGLSALKLNILQAEYNTEMLFCSWVMEHMKNFLMTKFLSYFLILNDNLWKIDSITIFLQLKNVVQVIMSVWLPYRSKKWRTEKIAVWKQVQMSLNILMKN